MKKSQITFFMIIIAVLLFVLVAAYLMVTGFTIGNNSEKSEVKSFVESCLTTAEECVLERIGENGAGFTYSNGLLPLNNAKADSEGKISGISKLCQNNFNDFDNRLIKADNPKTILNFNKEDTTSELQQQIVITEGEKTTTLTDFKSNLPVRFKTAYDLSASLMGNSGNYIDTDLLSKEFMNVKVYQAETNNLFVITDAMSKIKGDTNYKLSFVK